MRTKRDGDDPFAAVHRLQRRRTAGWGSVAALAVAAVIGFAWVAPGYAAPPVLAVVPPAPASTAAAETPAEVAPVAQGAAEAAPDAGPPAPADASGVVPQPSAELALPTAPPAEQPAPVADPIETPGPVSHEIAVDASGYQVELDRCLWVRMDIGATAPIVGAHNTCGGDVVLTMALGDTVYLTGEGLDGSYLVTGEREATKGQNAFQATDGMGATVILQTCHWEGEGVRLLALQPLETTP